MPQPRASRLNKKPSIGFMADSLPYGSFRRKLILWVIVPVVLFLIAFLLVDKVIMQIITRHGSEFPLPDMVGQQNTDARITLDNLDLRYEIASEEFSPGQPQGTILGQFPIAGTKVKKGRTIKFVISAGQKMVPIPETAGKSVRQALLDLETAGLILGEIAWAFSDTMPEKVVVFSYPSSGTEIPLGTPVNLMVNHGRASSFTYMPNVVGLPLPEARQLIESKELKVGLITTRIDENYLPETVLEQSEGVANELDVGTEIDLVVSTTG